LINTFLITFKIFGSNILRFFSVSSSKSHWGTLFFCWNIRFQILESLKFPVILWTTFYGHLTIKWWIDRNWVLTHLFDCVRMCMVLTMCFLLMSFKQIKSIEWLITLITFIWFGIGMSIHMVLHIAWWRKFLIAIWIRACKWLSSWVDSLMNDQIWNASELLIAWNVICADMLMC